MGSGSLVRRDHDDRATARRGRAQVPMPPSLGVAQGLQGNGRGLLVDIGGVNFNRIRLSPLRALRTDTRISNADLTQL